VNHTAEAPALKRIHLISIGRQGSCEALELFQRAGGGLPGLSEPLRFTVEGRTILTDPDSEFKRQQVRCLFSENFSEQDASSTCLGGLHRIVNTQALLALKELAANPGHPPLVLKTTRIVNLRLLAEELSPEQIRGSKFVVLVRDPRAVWASFKPFPKWAIHEMPLVCKLLAESLLTIPALADVASDHLEVALYEEWTKDLARFAEQMGFFLGLDSTEMVRFAREKQREPVTPKWVGELTDKEVSQIENDPYCRAYMDRVGYKPGKEKGIDHSGLRSSAELKKGLSSAEQSVISALLAEGRADAEHTRELVARAQEIHRQRAAAKAAADRVVMH